MSDEDDIEAYLTTFATMIVAYEVPKECRVFRLVSQREGEQSYATIAAENTGDYDQLKVAIFQQYSITVARVWEELYTKMVNQVMDLAQKWTW